MDPSVNQTVPVGVPPSERVMEGASLTVRVNPWFASGPELLWATIVKEYWLPVPLAGVPLSVPVPFPLSTKAIPPGSDSPTALKLGVGVPVAVTVNEPALPTTKVALFALVMAGGFVGAAACVIGTSSLT